MALYRAAYRSTVRVGHADSFESALSESRRRRGIRQGRLELDGRIRVRPTRCPSRTRASSSSGGPTGWRLPRGKGLRLMTERTRQSARTPPQRLLPTSVAMRTLAALSALVLVILSITTWH